jgi:hypothetical protein
MNDSQTGDQVELGPMGGLGNPFQVVSHELVVGSARVLQRVREDHRGMGNGLLLVYFFLYLQDCLVVSFVVLNQELNVLLL